VTHITTTVTAEQYSSTHITRMSTFFTCRCLAGIRSRGRGGASAPGYRRQRTTLIVHYRHVVVVSELAPGVTCATITVLEQLQQCSEDKEWNTGTRLKYGSKCVVEGFKSCRCKYATTGLGFLPGTIIPSCRPFHTAPATTICCLATTSTCCNPTNPTALRDWFCIMCVCVARSQTHLQ
jgi:hypothetical protein